MRTLFILRGAPASGKSTWIQENNLEPYTISTDTLRLMYQSPITNTDGTRAISQNHDGEVWKMVLELMERRMDNGEFIIVDATHYKAPLINKYKDLVSKYRYRVFVVDFSKITEEELLERNSKRGFRRVPDDVIQKMVVALADETEVKKSYKIITPQEAKQIIEDKLVPFNANEYEKVVVFGDIHGCFDPLKEYFDKNPFNENYNYIFCGDYLDRGPQNKEVLEFLISLKDKKNCVFLEGNHEKWLRIYADKHFNMEDYQKKEIEYKDPFITKIIAQLKDRLATLQKKIRVNNTKSEELSKLLREAWEQNPDTREVYYEFELVNVPETQKQLHKDNNKYEHQIDVLKTYLSTLRHEEFNSNNLVTLCKIWFLEEFNCGLSFDITNILERNYNVISNKKDNPIKSPEFIKRTYPQIKDIDKTEIRRFCDRLSQMSYFTFNGFNFLVTHAGVPCLPDIKTPAIDFIKGVGKYEEHELIDKQFSKNTDSHTISIHGHRNTMRVPLQEDVTYNLEGQVEFGGHLRIIEIPRNDKYLDVNCIEIKNNNYIEQEQEEPIQEKSQLEILRDMYRSPLIQVKELGDNIISLNFTREAFYDRRWNDLTCTARGLFVDKTNGNIISNSYCKFFNRGEVDATKPEALKQTFKYPVIGYKKENGFLALISKYNGEIYFFTKSTNRGDYVNWFIGVLCNKYNIYNENLFPNTTTFKTYTELYNKLQTIQFDADKLPFIQTLNSIKFKLQQKLDSYIEEGKTYIFECVDIENDPHIIKYAESNVYLLDVKTNNFNEEYMSYENVCKVAEQLSVPVKQAELQFNNWEEFNDWRIKFGSGATQWDCKHEGYVMVDANNFRVKYKSSFYSFWKQMRAVKEAIQSGKGNKKVYKTKEEIQVVKLLESIPREELKEMSIIDIEDKFYENYEG